MARGHETSILTLDPKPLGEVPSEGMAWELFVRQIPHILEHEWRLRLVKRLSGWQVIPQAENDRILLSKATFEISEHDSTDFLLLFDRQLVRVVLAPKRIEPVIIFYRVDMRFGLLDSLTRRHGVDSVDIERPIVFSAHAIFGNPSHGV